MTAAAGVVTTANDVGGGSGEHACGQPKVVETTDRGGTFDLCGTIPAPDAGHGGCSGIAASDDGEGHVTFIATLRHASVAPSFIASSEEGPRGAAEVSESKASAGDSTARA